MRARGARVAIGLGSNLGDRAARLERAVAGLRELLDELRVSSVYETVPVHADDQPDYLNACCTGHSRLTPRQLLSSLQDMEGRLGRRRGGRRFGPRIIDLDLLLYEELIVEEPDLVVPHPRLRARAFVLVPLAELAADWMVPASGDAPEASVGRLVAGIDRSGVELTNFRI
jgi:2-amino-4-hydroxy-6-hydroxymethyldihydropteridine diphosphokinase